MDCKGITFGDILANLYSGELRVGIYVQGFANGGNESFVNNLNPVPETGTLPLLGSGLASLGLLGRRKFRRK